MDALPMRDLFDLPDGVIYLDGNSLGPLPRAAADRVAQAVSGEWGEMLIGGWNKAGWMEMPSRLGDRIAPLIGAPRASVVVGETLSIRIFQALAAAVAMRPDRHVILTDRENFPTDIYMAEGLARLTEGRIIVNAVPRATIDDALDENVAAVMLTHVDYRTGAMFDMAAVTDRVRSAGAAMIWDLAHSAGAVPVDLTTSGAEFAAGCTYKYLNAGPGAPAFIYVRPDIADTVTPALSGWLGHADPFAFEGGYRPAGGIERMRIGTPPVLQMAALDAALDIWDRVDMREVRRRSVALSERFIAEVERRCPALRLVSPREAAARGSQVSFAFAEGYEVMQALIARGVIGDFRAPDILRFGIAPLYLGEDEIGRAAAILAEVLDGGLWTAPEYRVRSRVT